MVDIGAAAVVVVAAAVVSVTVAGGICTVGCDTGGIAVVHAVVNSGCEADLVTDPTVVSVADTGTAVCCAGIVENSDAADAADVAGARGLLMGIPKPDVHACVYGNVDEYVWVGRTPGCACVPAIAVPVCGCPSAARTSRIGTVPVPPAAACVPAAACGAAVFVGGAGAGWSSVISF